ncbi:hypothetical protein AGOR_G00229780 [Albula goreensis]|uniref:BTB domain-containing protein n=1 Tax=Albula goreensis TaxID=1534307 RepID=A0A8T3CJV3_9TELE|nr:hypothetical protein AGOR_G00229780 [Albula goreensis]
MLAVHGSGQQVKRTATSREASTSAAESSLTWCLAQLSKAGNAARDQTDGGGKLDNKDLEKVKETDRKARAGLWRALVAIRTRHIKGGSAGIARYRARGGLQPLLEVLRHPARNRKTLDLALSILANCCTESETRVEVRKLGGICQVVEVLKNVPVETVQNRAARALGNLAIDPLNSALIHSAGGVSPLILCLSPPSCSSSSPPHVPVASPCPKLECAQSAARALLYLSDTPANRHSLLSQGALPALALLIAPEYPPDLRRASLRALNELTRGCSTECAREVSRSGALAQLGVLASDESSQPLREIALKTLANLCTQGCLRPMVGSLGVIKEFVEEVKKAPSKSGLLFRALCLCCKEAVNRMKVKESGGLEVLISFLSANQSHPLSRLAVCAFVDFVYDESALEQLQGLGLVPLLVARLVELAKGEEITVGEIDTPLSSSASELIPTSCFDSFDFPPPEGNKREEGGKEQGQGSSSFLSLRSWLLSEGLISCEGELLSPSGSGDGNWGSLCSSLSPLTPLSDRLSPLTCPSPTLTSPIQSSTPTSQSAAPPSPPTPPVPTTPSALILPSSYHKRAASSASNPLPPTMSAPQQSPNKPMSPSSRSSSPPRRQSQVRSNSSSSTAPPQTPPGVSQSPAYQHPYHPEPWTTESPILLLLSRFSQSMDPSSALINSSIISSLLYYLTQREDPSARCFRMLCRLSCNPNCLQGLVRTGSVALIWQRLCLREGLREGDRQKDKVKANIRQLGKALLNNLRLQCESSFGSGVLTHIMLSGSDIDRLYCALSLPLINGNKLLLKKLLLDHGGLQTALEHISWNDDDSDLTLGCWRSLSSWLYPPQPVTSTRLRSLYFSLLTECLSCLIGQPKLELDKQSVWLSTGTRVDVLLNSVTLPLVSEKQSHLPPPFKKPCLTKSCPYLDSEFNVVFLLDDGSQVAANKDAVTGEDGSERVGSEYFRALLKGGFGEAQRNSEKAIPIKYVTTRMLLPVLHYLHGCNVDPAERDGDKDRGSVERKGNEHERKSGHCVVLGWLKTDGLGNWKKSKEGEVSSEEGEVFQNTPLAEAMAGASRFLVSGLQRELEALCVSLLQCLRAPQPSQSSSVDAENPPVSTVGCGCETTGTESVGKSGQELTLRTATGKELSSESDSDFEMLVEPKKQTPELKPQLGLQQSCSNKQRSQLQSRQETVTGITLDLGTRRKPILFDSVLDQKIERFSQATSQSCCVSDCASASDVEACSLADLVLDSNSVGSPHTSGQDSVSASRQKSKSSSVPDKTSGPKLGSGSRSESNSDATPSPTPNPASYSGYEKWPIFDGLPELYCFSQLHSYPRLGKVCLSVLLSQQRTLLQPPSLTADCLSRLARRSHCIDTLKRDLLGLASQALS